MKRKIVKIEEKLCNGCGICVPNCAEGALQIIDGKARLISDLFCDGLGACIGECPEGAISIEEREAEAYDEKKVMEYIVKSGDNVITAHLNHLLEHNEVEYYNQGIQYLKDNNINYDLSKLENQPKTQHQACPGTMAKQLKPQIQIISGEAKQEVISSQLGNWPIQLHLISPNSNYIKGAELLLVADCVPFAYPEFHSKILKGKTLTIACPKLDSNKDIYVDKLATMISQSNIKSITVAIMEVPCCGGLISIVQKAKIISGIDIPINNIIISIDGKIICEEKI